MLRQVYKRGLKHSATMLLAAVITLLGAFGPNVVHAKGPVLQDQLGTISQSQLPVQGQNMLALIYQGGPFKYDKDGTVFGNRERILPAKNRGYYHEYTVKTPNERSRGARRIICGGLKTAAPDACYYTDDHYSSFRKITP